MSKAVMTPVDPAAEARAPSRPHPQRAPSWPVIAAVSAGGVVGAVGRHVVSALFPHRTDEFPWATFGINVAGCLLIGILMVLIREVWPDRPLLRPLLGVGVLGGFTTFSTYVVETHQAITSGAARTGLLYLAATVVAALVAVWVGTAVTSWAVRARRQTTSDGEPR